MKKLISVFLAALMLMTCMVTGSFAVDGVCDCDDHTELANACKCCIYCDNLDYTYVMNCVKVDTGNNNMPVPCCNDCVGIYPCACGVNCGCKSCVPGADMDITAGDSSFGDFWTEQDQQNFIDGFQAVLKKISDFFDMLFDKIFEFLRIEDVLGNGSTI